MCIECEFQNKVDVDVEIDSLAEVVCVVNLCVDLGFDLEFRIDTELQVFPADIEVYMEVGVDNKVCIEFEVVNIQIIVFVRFLVVFGTEVFVHPQFDTDIAANIEFYVAIRNLVVMSTGKETEVHVELSDVMLQF